MIGEIILYAFLLFAFLVVFVGGSQAENKTIRDMEERNKRYEEEGRG